nr:hypothetical protein [Sulfuricurvum sp. IAE1]
MSWLFSRALVAEYSAENFSDGEPSAPLSVMPTPHKFWHNDKMTEPSNLSRYGLTCEVLTDTRGEELLMSYLAGSHVRTSALPEKDADWTESDPVYGEKWRGSSAKYDPDTFSWKIRRSSLFGEEIELLVILPRWGMTVNGELSERTIPVLPTSATAFGSSRSVSGKSTQTSELSESLFDEIEFGEERSTREFFYTPKANDAEKRGKVSADKRNGIVGQVMNFYPTPLARDWRGNLSQEALLKRMDGSSRGVNLAEHLQRMGEDGLLNPDWEEWLMGWPIGHTALKPLETDRFQEWYRWHGAS